MIARDVPSSPAPIIRQMSQQQGAPSSMQADNTAWLRWKRACRRKMDIQGDQGLRANTRDGTLAWEQMSS